jgi:hypothetical protein
MTDDKQPGVGGGANLLHRRNQTLPLGELFDGEQVASNTTARLPSANHRGKLILQ